MRKSPKRTQQADKVLYRTTYSMELARGSSHIASTLSPETRRVAIAEVLDEFAALHGADKLAIFRELLAESLEKRDRHDAAQAVLKARPLVLPGVDAKSAGAKRSNARGECATRTVDTRSGEGVRGGRGCVPAA